MYSSMIFQLHIGLHTHDHFAISHLGPQRSRRLSQLLACSGLVFQVQPANRELVQATELLSYFICILPYVSLSYLTARHLIERTSSLTLVPLSSDGPRFQLVPSTTHMCNTGLHPVYHQ